MINLFKLQDIIIFPLCILLIIFFIKKIYKSEFQNFTLIESNILNVSIALKIGSLFSYPLVIMYMYNGVGDTVIFFKAITEMHENTIEDPMFFFQVFFSDYNVLNNEANLNYNNTYIKSFVNYSIVRIGYFFSLLTNNSYLGISTFLSIIPFTGCLSLYFYFRNLIFTHTKNKFSESFLISLIFLNPILQFWSNGLIKDGITLGCSSFFICFLCRMLFSNENKFKLIVLLVISSLGLLFIKPYILIILLLPSFFLVIHSSNMKPSLTKQSIIQYTLVFGAIIFSIVLSLKTGGKDSDRYNIYKINNQLSIHHDYVFSISQQQEGSTVYTFIDTKFSVRGIMTKFPHVITTILFRPFIWEKQTSILMTFTSFINLINLIGFILIFSKVGLIKVIKYLFSEPIILYFIVVIILYSYLICLTSPNFGTILRYKLPIIPLNAFILSFLISKIKM